MVRRFNLAATGNKVAKIPVTLSYQIIQHFSAGLYTSPNKALEELVANSYDAGARHAHIILPTSLDAEGATIWVIDDGHSMGIKGFQELWNIGESSKGDAPVHGRLPIGKYR